MSTAWYKSRFVPELVRSWTRSTANRTQHEHSSFTIEVWNTTCIVTNDFGPEYRVLVNPGNPNLTGVSQFPYFPVGGPEPPEGFRINKDTHPVMGYVSRWGGMEVGNGMMFASNVVDGMVHQLGGAALQRACREALVEQYHQHNNQHPSRRHQNARHEDIRLAEGYCVTTPALGSLGKETNYQYIIHTVPPFYNHPVSAPQDDADSTESTTSTAKRLLAASYRNILELIRKSEALVLDPSLDVNSRRGFPLKLVENYTIPLKIACPLLGAGCRGFPLEEAVQVAAQTLVEWQYQQYDTKVVPLTLAFGIPSNQIRERLMDALDQESERRKKNNKSSPPSR